jgi:hypothetical protein
MVNKEQLLPKSPASLLVHLSSWCNPIDRHEKHFLRFYNSEQHLGNRQMTLIEIGHLGSEVYPILGNWDEDEKQPSLIYLNIMKNI